MNKNKNLNIVVGIFSLSVCILSCSFNKYDSNPPVEIIISENSSFSKEGGSTLSEKPNLDEYILHALKENQDIRAAFNLYQASKEKSPQVSSLPEPKLSYGYFINSIETRVGPMQQRVGLSQEIPWFGKLSLREEIANEEAKVAYYSFLTIKNKLVSNVIKAFYELIFINEARVITKTNLELLKSWEQVLNKRYRSQVGSQADLIKVQVELGKLEDKLKELNDLVYPLKAHFNALLNRPGDSKVVTSKNILNTKLSKESQSISSSSKKSLELILLEQNPEIQLLNALVEVRKKGISLAKKDFYPDFSIGGEYTFIGEMEQGGFESGNDALAAIFSINIPINFSKYRAGLNEAKFRDKAAMQTYTSRKLMLSSVLARNLFEISDSKRRVSLYQNTLVPKAQESIDSTYTAFESGEASFLDLLDTERELLDFKLMLSRAQADLVISISSLRSLLGDYTHLDRKKYGKKQ